jgi:hypothetical protein
MSRGVVVVVVAAVAAVIATLARAGHPVPPTRTLLAVGDITSCATTDDEAVAKLVGGLSGTLAVLGDNAYESGTAAEYANCYAPAWGPFLARTRPTPGNHEYRTPKAAGYYGYFGAAAAPPWGWYSYDLGAWHVIVLNSNCHPVGGCGRGSRQERWLRRDLARHRRLCTLAYWHHPLYTSGIDGNNLEMRPFWNDLYEAGAELVLNGHEHVYERLAPQTPAGRYDLRRGIREFVVGTGGRSHETFTKILPTSMRRNATTFGVLRLTLARASYSWKFLPSADGTYSDSGSARCHR